MIPRAIRLLYSKKTVQLGEKHLILPCIWPGLLSMDDMVNNHVASFVVNINDLYIHRQGLILEALAS
jgi:hypothetical protein